MKSAVSSYVLTVVFMQFWRYALVPALRHMHELSVTVIVSALRLSSGLLVVGIHE